MNTEHKTRNLESKIGIFGILGSRFQASCSECLRRPSGFGWQVTGSRSQGFSLLLAILISSLLLAVGLGIFNLALKESIISSGGRESQFAIYAADSGIECALYYDFGPEGGGFDLGVAPTPITCNDGEITVQKTGDTTNATSTFKFALSNEDLTGDDVISYSVEVSVGKHLVGSVVKTIIQARGYNTDDLDDPRRVERALQVTY